MKNIIQKCGSGIVSNKEEKSLVQCNVMLNSSLDDVINSRYILNNVIT
jgi:hypothetical protein